MSLLGRISNKVIDMRFWVTYASGYVSLLFGIYNMVVLTSLRFPQFNAWQSMVLLGSSITVFYLLFGYMLEKKGFVDKDLKKQSMKNEELQMLNMVNNCYSRQLLIKLGVLEKCDPRMQKLCLEFMPEWFRKCKNR